MATALISHPLDPTGVNPNNRVSNEIQDNVDPTNGFITLEFGRYFSESIVIKETVSNTPLIKGVDFLTTDFDQKASLVTGKEICGSIIVIKNNIVPSYTITYQALGGDHGYSNENLLAVLQDKILPNYPVTWDQLEDKPTEFKAKPHLHDIREIYGFEYIAVVLGRIESGLRDGGYYSFSTLISYVEQSIHQLELDMIQYINDNLPGAVERFKAQFDKVYFEVDKLSNLAAAGEKEGLEAGHNEFTREQVNPNLYMTIEALIGLKRTFFEEFVTAQDTGLGKISGTYGIPMRIGVFNMTTGQRFNVISRLRALEEGLVHDTDLYPAEVQPFSELTMLKIGPNLTNRAGVMQAFDAVGLNTFLVASESESPLEEIKWKRNVRPEDVSIAESIFESHVKNRNDPHKTTSFQISLGKVENLPVISNPEIMTLRSTRKYVTLRGLIQFMKSFLIREGDIFKPVSPDETKKVIDNCVVVYTPSGVGLGSNCGLNPIDNECVDPPPLTNAPTPTSTGTPTPTPTSSGTATPSPTPTGTTHAPTSTSAPPTTTHSPTPTPTKILTKSIRVILGPNVVRNGMTFEVDGRIKLNTGTGEFTYGFGGGIVAYNKFDYDISSGSSNFTAYVDFRSGGGIVAHTDENNRIKIASMSALYQYMAMVPMTEEKFNSITIAYYDRDYGSSPPSGGSGMSSS